MTLRPPRLPPYFGALIAAFRAGRAGRHAHLGWWDQPPPAGWWRTPGAFTQAQARLDQQLLALAGLDDGQCVLDVGCGLGATLAAVDAHHRGMRLLGLNVDARQLALCAGLVPRPGNQLAWLQADALALPLAAGRVDRLLCVEAMFHFGSRRRFLHEAARVLAPGGRLVASDIVLRGSDDARADAALAALLDTGFGPWPDPWCREGELGALAAEAGLHRLAGREAAANTLPSHEVTAPPLPAPGAALPRDPGAQAAAALATLHRAGRLSYPLMVFEKPAR